MVTVRNKKNQGSPVKQRPSMVNTISHGASNPVTMATDAHVKSTSDWDGEHSLSVVTKENYRNRTQCCSDLKISNTETFYDIKNAISREKTTIENIHDKYLPQLDIDITLDPLVDIQFLNNSVTTVSIF